VVAASFAVQAAAEYVGVVAQRVAVAVGDAAVSAFHFFSTPTGLLAALIIVVLLAVTVGRRRRI